MVLNFTQQMLMDCGVCTSRPQNISGYLRTLRGASRFEDFPKTVDHLVVIERDGEAQLERLGIPPEQRMKAILETRCGGPNWPRASWATYGVVAFWKRTESCWQLVSAERRKLGGGKDRGFLTLTPEQIELRNDQAARNAYAIRARLTGDCYE